MRAPTAARAWLKPLATLLALNLAAALTLVVQRTGEEMLRITAHFSRSVGLYPGSSVRVLGVKIGTVRSITPEGRSVRVELEVDREVRVPAGAGAVIIPPSLVSDRYVQLVPAYTGGPTLPDGAEIPLDRTRTPVELDEILASLDRFLTALGPDGANAKGSLADLVDVGAKALGNGNGNGKQLNQTLQDLTAAVSTLAGGRDDLGEVLANLSSFTATLARNDRQIRVLTSDLATVSEQLAGERKSLEQALANLAVALGEINSLVRNHRETLGADVETLAQVTRTVLKHRQSLVEALDTTPLHLANLTEAVNTERGTLDIRNDNEQGDHLYDILVCQVLAPILDITCPPDPTDATGGSRPSGAGAGGAAGRAGAPGRSAPRPAVPLDRFSLEGMLRGAR